MEVLDLQVKTYKDTWRFLNRILASQREWYDILNVLKWKNIQPRILYPVKLPFKIEGEIVSQTKTKEFHDH